MKESKSFRHIAAELFEKIVEGETWADRITHEVDEQWLCPHLAYYSKSGRGCVRFPPHDDPLALASWIAHECGHFEDFGRHPPGGIMTRIEQLIRSERVYPIIRGMVRKAYYLIFWRERMRREISAHKTEIRLIKKIGFPLEAIRHGDDASDEILPPISYYGFIERLFSTRMQKAQDELTNGA